jgi:hypothetical protein
MTPTVTELLAGNFRLLATPPPPESAGDYTSGMIGVTGMISALAAQEAERGAAVRIAENAMLRALFSRAGAYDAGLDGRLSGAASSDDGDLSITALDAANATLRRALIALHEAVEAAATPRSMPRS